MSVTDSVFGKTGITNLEKQCSRIFIKSHIKQTEMEKLTARGIAKKYASSIGGKGLGSARFDLSKECEEEIIDFTKRKIKERDEQWFDGLYNLGNLIDPYLIDEVNRDLPELKFE